MRLWLGWVLIWCLPWEARTRVQALGLAQAGCEFPCHSPKASMQPRSSSSTVQPLSRSRVPAMAAGAGRLGHAALRG